MMKVASFDARVNDGEPTIYRRVRSRCRWRVEIRTKKVGQPQVNVVINVVDKLPIQDVYEIARDALREQIDDGEMCEIGRFDLWADA
jgi:hypothetical protein